MCSTRYSTLASGNSGSSQTSLDNQQLSSNNISNNQPTYAPSKKHEESGWGSKNPITSNEEGQRLLDSSYPDGKQRYNVTKDGKFVCYQPDNTPQNGYHSYEINGNKVPSSVLKKMYNDGLITKVQYNKARKGSKKW